MDKKESNRIESVRIVWLQAAIEVAELKSRTEAAKRIGCTQPMIGRYLAHLEAWLGSPVFVSVTDATLTEEGTRLIEIARQVIQLLESVAQKPITPRASTVELSGDDLQAMQKSWIELGLRLDRVGQAQHQRENEKGEYLPLDHWFSIMAENVRAGVLKLAP